MRNVQGLIVLVLATAVGAVPLYLLFQLANQTSGVADWFGAFAGWAQAWGAVVGIGAAYKIAADQRSAEATLEAAALKRTKNSVKAAAEHAVNLVRTAEGHFAHHPVDKAGFDQNYRPEDFTAAIEVLCAAPLYQLGSYTLTERMVLLTAHMRRTQDLLKRSGDVASLRPIQIGELSELLTRANNLLGGIIQEVNESSDRA